MLGSCVGYAVIAYAGYVLFSRARRALAGKGCSGDCARCPFAKN